MIPPRRSADEERAQLIRDGETFIEEGERVSTWPEFHRLGLLWLFNAQCLNPRGFHMAMFYPTHEFTVSTGFTLFGDGRSPWQQPTDAPAVEQAFRNVKRLLA